MRCRGMDETPVGWHPAPTPLPAPTGAETNKLGSFSQSALLSVSVCLSLFLSLCVSPSVSFYISLTHISLDLWLADSLFLSE